MLVDNRSVAQGEELCAMARLAANDGQLPETLIVTGTLDGKPFAARLPVQERGRRSRLSAADLGQAGDRPPAGRGRREEQGSASSS